MRRTVISLLLALSCCIVARGSEFNSIPSHWKWISGDEIAFSHDGSFKDSLSFSICARNGKRTGGICFPPRFQSFPVEPEGAQNLTFSPDSTMLAFTREGNLFVLDISSGKETGLTSDGGPAVYNGYASWVYYEEILGRASRYKAFWWSPDGKWLAFYRFDDSKVPVFPIYSPFGGGGKLRETRYPRAGESNPEVRIGFADVKSALSGSSRIVWADFDPESDQYFGIPFWSRDSRFFYVSREPRIQNTLELYAVSPENGRKAPVYREVSSTWLDWIEGMLFSRDGLYMARSFESDWQQVYFLSYDGSVLRRLTDGTNWNVRLEKVLPDGTLFFTANRDSQVRRSLYKVDPKGRITCMSDPSLNVDRVLFAPGGKYYAVSMSSYRTPTQIWVCRTSGGKAGKGSFKVADLRGDDYDPSRYSFPEIVTIDREGMEGMKPFLQDLYFCSEVHGHDTVIGLIKYDRHYVYEDDNGRDLHNTIHLEILKKRGLFKKRKFLIPTGYFYFKDYAEKEKKALEEIRKASDYQIDTLIKKLDLTLEHDEILPF